MFKPKNIFQVDYFYFDKYNNEKLIQERKSVPPNITCMYIRNNVRYMSFIRIVGFKLYSADCRENQCFLLLCSNLLEFPDIKLQDPTISTFFGFVSLIENGARLHFFIDIVTRLSLTSS